MEQQDTTFEVGSHVQIMSYGPFRGLRGTIQTVDMIAPDREGEEPFCFYKIALEGAHIQEPIWFESDEAELVALPSLVPQGRG
jgi:hypothetical protein